jgi:hypothetical protein
MYSNIKLCKSVDGDVQPGVENVDKRLDQPQVDSLLTIMTIFFKLKKTNASTRLAYFSEKPSWEDLTSKIARLFNIPSDRVGVAFVEKEEPITLRSEDELQGFYKYKSSEVIDLVVQDTLDPDSKCLIGSYSRNSHRFPTSPDVSQLYMFSLHSPTHSAGFRFATTPLASITSTWLQDTNLSDLFKSAAVIPTKLIIGSDDKFKLFCWVLGAFGAPFPVDIDARKTVGDLKNAIKKVKVHAFAEIDAGTLDLWKVGFDLCNCLVIAADTVPLAHRTRTCGPGRHSSRAHGGPR